MTWKTRILGLAMAVATLAVLALASGADWYGD
jgi:hypothetical protein